MGVVDQITVRRKVYCGIYWSNTKSHVSMNELVGVEKGGGGEGSPADPAGVGPPWGPTPTLQVGPQTTTEEEALATVLT